MTYTAWTATFSVGMDGWIVSRTDTATGGKQSVKRKGDFVRPITYSSEAAAAKRAAKENAA